MGRESEAVLVFTAGSKVAGGDVELLAEAARLALGPDATTTVAPKMAATSATAGSAVSAAPAAAAITSAMLPPAAATSAAADAPPPLESYDWDNPIPPGAIKVRRAFHSAVLFCTPI